MGPHARLLANSSQAFGDNSGFRIWKRVVEVTKSGPALLSVLVSDSADCGGVHPFDETFPLVYDLRTGDAVRWDKVFPEGRAEEVNTSSNDGMPWITIRSKRLQALY